MGRRPTVHVNVFSCLDRGQVEVGCRAFRKFCHDHRFRQLLVFTHHNDVRELHLQGVSDDILDQMTHRSLHILAVRENVRNFFAKGFRFLAGATGRSHQDFGNFFAGKEGGELVHGVGYLDFRVVRLYGSFRRGS